VLKPKGSKNLLLLGIITILAVALGVSFLAFNWKETPSYIPGTDRSSPVPSPNINSVNQTSTPRAVTQENGNTTPTGTTSNGNSPGSDAGSISEPYGFIISKKSNGVYYAQSVADNSIVSTSSSADSITQSIINSIPSNTGINSTTSEVGMGAELHFLAGEYVFYDTVSIVDKKITISGSGWTNTVLKMADGVNKDMFHIGGGVVQYGTQFSMKDIYLEGNYERQSGISNCLVFSSDIKNTHLSGIYINNFLGSAITFTSSIRTQDFWLLDSSIENCMSRCIFSPTYFLFLNNNYFYNLGNDRGTGDVGVQIRLTTSISVTNNRFSKSGWDGLQLETIRSGVISNNLFQDNNQRNPGTIYGNGLYIYGSCYDLQIIGNDFAHFYTSTGKSFHKYDIYVANYGTTNSSIKNNNLNNWGTGPIFIGAGNAVDIVSNKNYNPLGYIANPFSGNTPIMLDSGDNATISSGWVYTNIQSPKVIYISGGSVTSIMQNGQTTGMVSGTIILRPQDTFSVTFTVAPTIVVMGQ
jgi:hypothetical protein